MGKLLLELKSAGSLKAYWDLRRGSLLDQIGTAAALSINGTPIWMRTNKGRGTYMSYVGATDYVYSDNPAALQLSTCTIFIVANRTQSNTAATQGLFGKTNAYALFHNSGAEPKAFCVYDYTASATRTSTFTASPDGQFRMYAVSFQSGVVNGTTFFVDGIPYGFNQTTVLNQGSIWTIGRAAATCLGGTTLLAGIVNRVLTPAEHTQLYDEYLYEQNSADCCRQNFYYQYNSKTDAEYAAQGIVLDSDFNSEVVAGVRKIRDLTGNYPGTILDCPIPGSESEGITFDGVNDGVNFGDVTQLNSASKVIVEWVFRPEEAAITNGDVLWSKNVTANRRFSAEFGAGGNPCRMKNSCENGAVTYGLTDPIVRSKTWNHALVAFDGTQSTDATKLRLYFNGEYVAYNGLLSGPIPATLYNNSGVSLYTGEETAGSNPSNITMGMCRISSGVTINETTARAAYLKNFAQKLIWQAPGEDIPVSLVASYSAGQYIGPWRVVSGTWKVSEDTTGKRWIECVTNGCVVVPQSSAFGTWSWTFSKTETGSMYFVMIGTSPVAWNAATQYGYVVGIDSSETLFSPALVSAGAPGPFPCYSSGGYLPTNTYSLAINRRPADGRFTSWIKGGSFANWTLASAAGGGSNPTAAEATFLTGNWFTVTATTGDKFLIHDPTGLGSHPKIYQGVLNPLSGEVP